jgi:hypothetical protein
MTDPRLISSVSLRVWSADERADVAHLEDHEAQAANPQPREDDSAAVRALFAKFAADEKAIKTMKELITALRERSD